MRAVSPIRWCRPGFFAAATCCFVVQALAQDLKPDVSVEMKKAFRQSFVYATSPLAKTPTPTKDYDVILMQPIIVRNRFEAEGLDQAIANQEAVDDRFTLYKGGAIYRKDVGRVRIDAGTWGSASGLNLLKLSW
jgi:hypothetical protein